MATTTNYGWGTPDDTDLVKDGALAIRDLGQDIDTTTKALNPETTTGDIAYRSATANTNTRLGIGSTGDVLTVAGGVPTWAAPAGGGSGLTLIGSPTSFSAVSSQSLNSVFTTDYTNYKVIVNLTSTSAAASMRFRLRAAGTDDTTSNYNYGLVRYRSGSATIANYAQGSSGSFIGIGEATGFSESHFFEFMVGSPQQAQNTYLNGQAGNLVDFWLYGGNHVSTTQFDGFSVIAGAGNMTGTIAVYGYAK